MELKIDVNLETLFETFNKDGVTYCRLRNDEEIVNDIKRVIGKQIFNSIEFCPSYYTNELTEKFLDEHKDEIISGVIKTISKTIIERRLIKDLKKELEEVVK